MYNYHDIFFYYAFGALNGGGGSIQVIGITEGTTSVTFESNGKPLITYRIYGSSSGVGDLNTETGKYDITVTCNEDTYTISLDAPLMDGEYIDYKTQRLYPSGLDVSMPEISTVSGTNTLTVITTNPSSKVYVECYRAKDVPITSPNVVIGSVPFDFECYEAGHLIDYSISGNAMQESTPSPDAPVDAVGSGVRTGNLAPPLSEWKDGYVASNTGGIAKPSPVQLEKVTELLPVPEGISNLTFSAEDGTFETGTGGAWRAVGFFDRDGAFISRPGGGGANAVTVTVPEGAAFMRICCRTYGSDKNYMLNLGSTALPYENFGYKIPITVKDFSCTILGVQQSTNYAYISKSDLPNASVGDYISTTIEGVDYSLAIMQIDDNYIYIENRTV